MGDVRTALSRTDMSAPSIQHSAASMMRLYDAAGGPVRAVDEWRNCLRTCRPSQLLPLLYVANEVLQTSKRNRGSKFLEAFGTALGGSLRYICERDHSVVEKVRRTVKIWGDRRVYSPRFVAELLAGLEEFRNGGKSGRGAAASAATTTATTTAGAGDKANSSTHTTTTSSAQSVPSARAANGTQTPGTNVDDNEEEENEFASPFGNAGSTPHLELDIKSSLAAAKKASASLSSSSFHYGPGGVGGAAANTGGGGNKRGGGTKRRRSNSPAAPQSMSMNEDDHDDIDDNDDDDHDHDDDDSCASDHDNDDDHDDDGMKKRRRNNKSMTGTNAQRRKQAQQQKNDTNKIKKKKKTKTPMGTSSLVELLERVAYLSDRHRAAVGSINSVDPKHLAHDRADSLEDDVVGDELIDLSRKCNAAIRAVLLRRAELRRIAVDMKRAEQDTKRYVPWLVSVALRADEDDLRWTDRLIERLEVLRDSGAHSHAWKEREKRRDLEARVAAEKEARRRREEEEAERRRVLEDVQRSALEAREGMVWNAATREYQYVRDETMGEAWRD